MKFARISALLVSMLMVGLVHAADTAAVKPAVASASAAIAVQATSASKTVGGKLPGKTPATTGAATTLKGGGNSSIPSGNIPIPPKPKKEEMPAINTNVKAQH